MAASSNQKGKRTNIKEANVDGVIVGIEVGSRYIKAGRVLSAQGGEGVELVITSGGERETPCYIGVSKTGERLYGPSAHSQAVRNEENTAYDILRYFGLSLSSVSSDPLLSQLRNTLNDPPGTSGPVHFVLSETVYETPLAALSGIMKSVASDI